MTSLDNSIHKLKNEGKLKGWGSGNKQLKKNIVNTIQNIHQQQTIINK